ncbi:MAG TPA: DoxX family protein [Chitinophagaceae bacterium]|nr:DoxX family protein [Chitinophagaceae bacterium]
MKKTNIFYWILTGLFAFMMGGSAIPDILMQKEAVDGITKMGYPAYFVPFIGWAKMLGVIAILVPGFPRIKEWAYAGLIFDLIAATYSLAVIGWPGVGFMALPLALGAGSYTLHHIRLKKRAARQQSIERSNVLLTSAVA